MIPQLPVFTQMIGQAPIMASSCDYIECLNFFINKYPGVPFADIYKSFLRITYMSITDIEKVLKKTLTNCQCTESACYDSQYVFYLTAPLYSPGIPYMWETFNGFLKGQGLPSLVRTVLSCSDVEAIEFIADVLDIDFSNRDVPQTQKWEGYKFIEYPLTYDWINSESTTIEFLRNPRYTYRFYNTGGHLYSLLLEWEFNGTPLLLFLTLQQPDNLGGNVWEFIAPPVKHRVYNQHLLEGYQGLEVYIHDEIRNADASTTSQTIGTWAGDLSFAADMDWSFLKGRKVKYIFNPNNPDSFQVGATLLRKFKVINTDLKLLSKR